MPYYHRPLYNEAAIAASAPTLTKLTNWGEQYIAMAEGARDWTIDVLNIAAKTPGALLYHCTTGKDRTGLMSCYLLSIAGVDIPDITADYCVSQVYLEPVYEKLRSGSIQLGLSNLKQEEMLEISKMYEQFFQTPPEAMLTLTDYLTKTYGGVVEYLKQIGVSQETMNAIRSKFVED